MNDRMFVHPLYAKPNVEYPCRWIYKVIGIDREQILLAIEEVMQQRPCEIRYSRSSAKGKYHSFSLEMTLHSDDQRLSIYEALMRHPAVRIVL
ncbi:hypothetical protein SAMN04489760_11017 [Syntrophus gentianae]|uniref:Lipoic acid-binding regulatory protein n=1 Tax=Syntrophus gentianae TaxID=43775 RepID=A0A1H7XD24_9BACT|nr:DUF493 domain-containing protein [Syntrophus gentianae]SEM31088.1 hypothetical protein SAMN04489760_11017 [Syntrophus gentianae]